MNTPITQFHHDDGGNRSFRNAGLSQSIDQWDFLYDPLIEMRAVEWACSTEEALQQGSCKQYPVLCYHSSRQVPSLTRNPEADFAPPYKTRGHYRRSINQSQRISRPKWRHVQTRGTNCICSCQSAANTARNYKNLKKAAGVSIALFQKSGLWRDKVLPSAWNRLTLSSEAARRSATRSNRRQ
jgi:hypothetical protein